MRSAVLVEPKQIELREVAVPQPPPGGIVVRVRAALTDGTDLKAYRRGHPRMPMPTPFGHEFAGDIAAAAPDVTNFAVGDPIMSVHTAPCGACFWCKRAQEELCESIMSTMILGAYAEYITVPAHIVNRNCFRKPPGLPYASAAFLEPVSCVVHSLELLNVQPADLVVVMGDGGFGLMHAMLLARGGARPVLVGRHDERLGLARKSGIEHVVHARREDPEKMIRALTNGRGADALVECTGVPSVWEAAPAMIRRGGTVSFFGGLPPEARVCFAASRLHYDEVRLLSPFHFRPESVKRAYDLLVSRAIDPRPLITATVPLANIVALFERLDAGEGIKFAIEP